MSFSTKSTWSPGGVRELLWISLPTIVSQSAGSLIMVTDRYLLRVLGESHSPAAMAGGFAALTLIMFCLGLVAYVTPLVGHYVGAKKPEYACSVLSQSFIIIGISYPFLLLIGRLGFGPYVAWAGLPAEEAHLAQQYFRIMNVGCLFTLADVAMGAFFAGIGKTWVVMLISIMGCLVNAPLGYYLIHYGIGGYWSGIEGAAIGAVGSALFMLGLYLYFYLQPHMRKTYGFRASLHINPVLLKKLFRYGAPTGTEFFLIFIVFTCFTSLYHSYGEGPALAMTAVQNWDVLSFLPMWGLNIGLMSLVGRHLGARNIDLALRTTWSGFKVAAIVVGASVIAFTLFPEPLLQVFLPETMTLDRSQVLGLGIPMLRLVALYCVAHSINLVLGATLRAAGDTRACMYAGISIHWSLLLVVYLSVRYWQFPPLVTWQFFVYGAFAESLFFILRFYWGPWKTARVI